MIVLSDTGFHAAEGDPTNLKLWVVYLVPADKSHRLTR
jgi:hypothetical protein